MKRLTLLNFTSKDCCAYVFVFKELYRPAHILTPINLVVSWGNITPTMTRVTGKLCLGYSAKSCFWQPRNKNKTAVKLKKKGSSFVAVDPGTFRGRTRMKSHPRSNKKNTHTSSSQASQFHHFLRLHTFAKANNCTQILRLKSTFKTKLLLSSSGWESTQTFKNKYTKESAGLVGATNRFCKWYAMITRRIACFIYPWDIFCMSNSETDYKLHKNFFYKRWGMTWQTFHLFHISSRSVRIQSLSLQG